MDFDMDDNTFEAIILSVGFFVVIAIIAIVISFSSGKQDEITETIEDDPFYYEGQIDDIFSNYPEDDYGITGGFIIVTAVEKVVSTARNEIGYLEKRTNADLDSKTNNAGSGNFTKYARDLDQLKIYNYPKNGFSWCDIFVDWCFIKTFGAEMGMKMTYQPFGGLGASCTYSARYYKNNNKYFKTPQVGDQIFFKDSTGDLCHTGLVIGIDSCNVYTVEGNTSSNVGVIANGGSVEQKCYKLDYNRIDGYGRPDYSLIPDEKIEVVVVSEEELKKFKLIMAEYRKELQDNDASSYSQEARDWAIANGIVSGGSSTEFNGMWEDFLTREQMVTMLYRFAKKFGF